MITDSVQTALALRMDQGRLLLTVPLEVGVFVEASECV